MNDIQFSALLPGPQEFSELANHRVFRDRGVDSVSLSAQKARLAPQNVRAPSTCFEQLAGSWNGTVHRSKADKPRLCIVAAFLILPVQPVVQSAVPE